MQDNVITESPPRKSRRAGFEKSELERRGIELALGAPVTGSVAVGDGVAVGFGDGTVRMFRPETTPVLWQAHRGVILCMAADGQDVLTGGDDGRFLRISPDGVIEELANFGTKWVDCVAASDGLAACSSGANVYVCSSGQKRPKVFEHTSTVGGLAFDKKYKRLAVTHYGGATLWQRGKGRWNSSKLEWKGFHGPVTFSPDGRYVVTAMQENALHGWRLRDKGHFEMAGYPTKVKSFAWVTDTPFLATSGADEAICWPFDGKEGPMGRSPVSVGRNPKQPATYVHALRGESAVFTGFRDGAVLLAELDEMKDAVTIRGSTGIEVTAITVSASRSHIFVGDAKGNVLWAPLWARDEHEKTT